MARASKPKQAASGMADRMRFGTSSWSEDSWVGSFYPPGTKPADYLSIYAQQFDTVEADVTYYRVPSRDMVRGWDRKTPAGFTLCAKFPRSVVHGGEGARPDGEKVLVREQVGEDVERFLDAMSLLGPKCGPLVLQFPYFGKEAFAGPEPFYERLHAFLSELPDDFRYAVEIRNRDWVKPELQALLAEQGVGFVLLDLAYMPHGDELARRVELYTANFSYLRLIGDRKKIDSLTDRFDRIVLDQRPRLERWAALLAELPSDVEEVFAFANNHYAGHGPASIRELAALLRGEEPPLPPVGGPASGGLFP